jgi:hypothetical protein
MKRVVRWARGRHVKETSDAASRAAGKSSKAIQRAAWRARCQGVKETSDEASGQAGKTLTSERCSELRGGNAVDEGENQAMQRAVQRARRR